MHKFMLSLCCSHKFGIAFRDASVGTSGRNLNNVITSILKSFVKPYSNPLISDLIVSVLKACP
ncbi:Nucleolar pre-ribosomal-associated protein 1, partial [Stegodyphus mimosarum]